MEKYLSISIKPITDVEAIVHMWPMIAPMLREDLKYKVDGTNEEVVYQRLIAKRIFMVQIFVDDKLKGIITMKRDGIRQGYMSIFNVYYDGKFDGDAWQEFEKFCKSQGCKGIAFLADRKGFRRRFEPLGFMQGSIELFKTFK